MNINQVVNRLQAYNNCVTERSWTKTELMLTYENEYIKLLRVDSSNHHIENNDMSKMWSIIIDKKKEFTNLPNFKELQQHITIKVTPVRTGELKGYCGIRIYKLKREPNKDVIKMILDYIFEP